MDAADLLGRTGARLRGWSRPGVLAALAFSACAYAYTISEQVPRGRITGRAMIAGVHVPAANATVYLHPATGSRNPSRTAVTDADGRFIVRDAVADLYSLTASTDAHEGSSEYVSVDEGKTADVTVMLERTRPDLVFHQSVRVFSTRERARLAVYGYVDPAAVLDYDRVALRLFRTRLSSVLGTKDGARSLEDLQEQVSEWSPSKANVPIRKGLLHPTTGPAPRLFRTESRPITEADREGFYHKQLDFGRMPAGLYLVEARHASRVVATWLLVTDMALIVKRAGPQLLAYAVDMSSGTPAPGGVVSAYREGKVVGRGRTGRNGLATLSVPETETDARLMTVVARGEDEAVVGRSESQFEDQGRYRVCAYTDRPIYRPGQRVLYKAILRRAIVPGLRYGVPAGLRASVEVRDPSGERIATEAHTTSGYGTVNGALDLSPEAPTGVYTIVTKVSGDRHTHDFVVASYRKPEFTVTVKPGKPRYLAGEDAEITVRGMYYFGAPMVGARVSYTVYRAESWADRYEGGVQEEDEPADYDEEGARQGSQPIFGHERYQSYGEDLASGDATLNEKGEAVVRFRTRVSDEPEAPSSYELTASVTVTDSTGREVTEEARTALEAGAFSVVLKPQGYLALPGRPSPMVVIVRDHEGRPVPNVVVDLEYGYERWIRRREETVLGRVGGARTVSGPDGRAVVPVTPPRTGELRVAALARDSAGRRVQDRTYLWVSTDEGGDISTEYSGISIATDRRRYAPGDVARVIINAQDMGQSALLTVEADRVYRAIVVPIRKRSTVLRVPVLREYGPNASLSACYVRGKQFTSSQAYLRVAMPQTRLKVTLTADRRAGPGQLPRYGPRDPVAYTVRAMDARGRPARCDLSLSVVDASIYALREDDPAALREAFYPTRSVSVDTSYSFAVEYLGDADKAEPQITARSRFPDTAYWNPSVQTDASGTAVVRLALPDNLTTWRATAMACSSDTRVGRATCEVVAAKDFLVRLEAPRFLVQQDRTRLKAIVHNETRQDQTALVRLLAGGLSVSGADVLSVRVPAGASAQVSWPVTAGGPGRAALRLTAWTPRVAGKPQYTDGLETGFPIRALGRDVVTSVAGEVTGRQAEQETMRLDPSAIPSATRLTVRITPSVAGALAGAVEYLVGYPYGCTEQTMSRFIPDMLVSRLTQRYGTGILPDISAGTVKRLPDMVRDGLTRLYWFQHESGGWGWWRHDADDPWMTAYVLWGLSVAREQGYPVSPRVIARGSKALVAALPAMRLAPDEVPFALYALARVGARETVRTHLTRIRLDELSASGLAYAVLTGKVLGRPASDAYTRLLKAARDDGGAVLWQHRWSKWSSDRAPVTAAALRALLAMDPTDARVPRAVRWLMTHRTETYWYSTRDTAAILTALCEYLTSVPAGADLAGAVRIRVNGRLLRSIALTPANVTEREITVRVPAAFLRPNKNDVTIERVGGASAVFYAVDLRQTVAMQSLPVLPRGNLSVKREYLRLTPKKAGHGLWSLQAEPTGNRLLAGDSIRVRLTIRAPHAMSYVLVEDPLPAGCEVSERGSAEDMTEWSYWYSSADVRDDRIAFFARDIPPGTHTIEYNLRAQTPGAFCALPTLVQCMYAPETRAESHDDRLSVAP